MSIDDPQPVLPADADGPGTALAEAGPLIGLPNFRSDPRFVGIDGSGVSVVVIDTGIDLDHPFFGPDANGDGVADRIVYSADFVGGASGANDLNGHGTHVSSILASQDATYPGVAPGANIIGLRVLDDAGNGSAANLESALQWVVAHVDQYNIVGVNMSLSFGDNHNTPTTRPDLGLSDELAALAAQNVIVASASGNDFFSFLGAPGVAYPSADPNSLSVGAVWDADFGGPINWADGARDNTTGPDRIVSFSQRHPIMTSVFAPGAAITAAAIGGGTTVLSGTSMATPIITGVAALMQQWSIQETGQRLSLSQFAELLKDSGIPILDGDDEDDNVPNTQQWYHRVDVTALADAVVSNGLSNLTLPKGMSLGSAQVPAGGTARLDFTIANQGATSTGIFTTGVYLSTDANVDSSDDLLMEVNDQLAPGSSVDRSRLAVAVPSGLTPGQYYVGVVVDSHDVVAEGNELNNVAAQPLAVTADSGKLFVVNAATNGEVVNGAGILNFGQIIQGSGNVAKTLRIYNDGNTNLELGPISLPAGFDAIGFPQLVAPGTSAEFSLVLVGSSSPGNYSGIASFDANDSGEPTFAFDVVGSVLEPDDHGNNSANATSVTVAATVPGRILRTGDVDWFRFSAIANVHYHFETNLQTLGDSVLRLIGVNGTTQLALNDDGPSGRASVIDWVAPADGFYYLEVSGAHGLEGFYELLLAAADDHGNDASTATVTSDPSSNPGIIESAGDEDWFSFVVSAGVTYRFTPTATSLPGATLRLIDRDGIAELSSSGVDILDGGALEWTPTISGTYYVVVTAAAPNLTGAYWLALQGEDDYGDNSNNALRVELPDAAAGRIDDPPDADWFSFRAFGGAEYQLTMVLGSLSASRLRLFDVDGTQQLAEVAVGPNPASTLTWVAPASGIYFVEASGLQNKIGSYALAFAVLDDYGDDAATAAPTSDPSTNPGLVESVMDRDWFSFDAFAGVAYRMEARLGELSGASVRIFGVDGISELASSGEAGAAPIVNWTAPADGKYYIEVSPAAGAQPGDYKLIVTGDDDHGDSSQNATPVAVSQNTDGIIERLGDVDWFVIAARAGIQYRVDVALETLQGAVVRVVGPDQVTELGAAVAGNGVVGSVYWTATTDGNYYFEVSEAEFGEPLDSNASNLAAESSLAAEAGGSYSVTATAVSIVPGDYDADQEVDGNDFLVWQRTLGSNGPGTSAPLDSEGFEPYAEIPLDGQFGWRQLGTPAGSAAIQSTVVAAGNRAVRVDRASGADNWWAVPLGVNAPTGPFVMVQWQMRVAATGAENGGLGPFMGVQAYDDARGFGLLGSLGVDATTMDVLYQRQGDGVIVETGRKVSPDSWYSYAMLLDFGASRFTIYLEHQPLVTNEFVDLHVDGANLDCLTDADIVALADQGNSASQLMAGSAYFDNFRILNGVAGDLFPADGNRDGVVDGLDLAVWKNHFGLSYARPAVGSSAETTMTMLAGPANIMRGAASLDIEPAGATVTLPIISFDFRGLAPTGAAAEFQRSSGRHVRQTPRAPLIASRSASICEAAWRDSDPMASWLRTQRSRDSQRQLLRELLSHDDAESVHREFDAAFDDLFG